MKAIRSFLSDLFIYEDEEEWENKYLRTWVQAIMQYAIIWSVGATCDAPSREKFDVFLKV